MPNLLAMSFEGELAPAFDLRCLEPGGKPPDGWGIGYYPAGEPSASILKEPAPPRGSIRSELIRVWEHLASSVFVLHMRRATWGANTDANTQPFVRSWGGRDWLFCHSGSLHHRVERSTQHFFDPVGSTDSELVFCELLDRIADQRYRSLREADLATIHRWLSDLNQHGGLSLVLTDGADVLAYTDRNDEGPLYLWQLLPPHGKVVFGDTDLSVDLTRRGIKSRKGVIISSEALVADGAGGAPPAVSWRRVEPGRLIVVRQGAIVADLGAENNGTPGAPLRSYRPPVPRPAVAPVQRYAVRHRTTYRYSVPVEQSTHLLRLTPAHDRTQSLEHHNVTVSVDARVREYDDVFGNRAQRVAIDAPYTELVIEAVSQVLCMDTDPLQLGPHARSTIPLVWMPWQRHMLDPYLLPPELPESQLRELAEYGMSFVERNDYDLVDTLVDLNQSIFNEYAYQPGSTTLATTAFDVYANRRGVCQDFTNLFICVARLLGVPSRYACGYIYTGPKGDNQHQGEASHAWAQVYLPDLGWKGFDPTNGVLTQTGHVRVAVGRNYVDATPTSGTLFVGGGQEILSVEVVVERQGPS